MGNRLGRCEIRCKRITLSNHSENDSCWVGGGPLQFDMPPSDVVKENRMFSAWHEQVAGCAILAQAASHLQQWCFFSTPIPPIEVEVADNKLLRPKWGTDLGGVKLDANASRFPTTRKMTAAGWVVAHSNLTCHQAMSCCPNLYTTSYSYIILAS